jgi:hypothetical protein
MYNINALALGLLHLNQLTLQIRVGSVAERVRYAPIRGPYFKR